MAAPKTTVPHCFMFADDGSVPNNPSLPMLLYRGVVDFDGTRTPERVMETLFARNGWGDSWRNGIFPYMHYHSMTHEALGVARGQAKIRFGGNSGQELDVAAGDVAVLPAGTGHHGLWVSADFVLIGAYPKNGHYDLCRGSAAEHERAVIAIPQVPLPDADPAFGKTGPLMRLWRA